MLALKLLTVTTAACIQPMIPIKDWAAMLVDKALPADSVDSTTTQLAKNPNTHTALNAL